MSIEAQTWAIRQPIKQSSAKFVLVMLANCADGKDFVAWPSIAYLAESTSQDRKTVVLNLARLREWGYIEDTGERKGPTGQVIVYRLREPVPNSVPVPKTDPVQKRTRSGNGTAPAAAPRSGENSSKNGPGPKTDRVQKRAGSVFSEPGPKTDRVPGPKTDPLPGPKTDHGTVIEPSIEPSREPEEGAEAPMPKVETAKDLAQWLMALQLPTGIDPEMWAEWVAYRRKQKNLTIRACKEALAELQRLHAQGHDPNDVMRYSMFRGWTGLFPRRDQGAQPGGGLNRQESLEQANRRVAEQAKAARERRKREGTLEYGLMTEAERADQAFQSAEGDQPFPEYP